MPEGSSLDGSLNRWVHDKLLQFGVGLHLRLEVQQLLLSNVQLLHLGGGGEQGSGVEAVHAEHLHRGPDHLTGTSNSTAEGAGLKYCFYIETLIIT